MVITIIVLAAAAVITVIVIAIIGPAGSGDRDASTSTVERSSEVPEFSEASTPPLPLPADEGSLVAAPLPESGSAEGDVVEGFPRDVIPVAPDSEVDSTSLAVEGDRVQAGLTARSTNAANAVIDHYRAVFTSLGLTERETDAVAGSTALVFTRGADNITLTVAERADGTAYTVVGVFTAK
ncbi:hypothetical protein [Marisediminicola antarctica]|uniref:hypothetical protein n=1 Tax=Marisediminicola antarctica TaxID=674079 RepID=UPI00137ACCD2|nr:hypothetical protein [Marisediminicola antarctica]